MNAVLEAQCKRKGSEALCSWDDFERGLVPALMMKMIMKIIMIMT